MLIQPITNQNYNKYQIQNRNMATSFKGEFGAKVLNEITTSGAKDQKGISEVLKKLGIGFMGLFSLSKLKDILETVATKNDELETKENELNAQVSERQKQLDSKEKEFNEQAAKRQEELNSREQKLNEQTAKRQEELDKQEQALISTKNILKQAEIDSVKSATRAFYGIEDPEITSYDSIGEQCLEVSSVLNGCKNVKISNLNSDSLQDLAVAMQNKDGRFTKEALTFLERIAGMHDFDMNDLIIAMYQVKDSKGDIDIERCTHFISLYALKNSTLDSVTDILADTSIESSESDENTVIVKDKDNHEIILPKYKYKKYRKLMTNLECLENELIIMQESRDKQIAHVDEIIDNNALNLDYYTNLQIKKSRIVSEYENKMLTVYQKIANIKAEISDLL